MKHWAFIAWTYSATEKIDSFLDYVIPQTNLYIWNTNPPSHFILNQSQLDMYSFYLFYKITKV